ncbi:MAG: CHAT domain-containing protein [Bacteroidota bacterium]
MFNLRKLTSPHSPNMPKVPVLVLAFANDREGTFLRSIAEEHRSIKAALAPLVDKNLIQVEELPNAKAEDIFEAFRKNKDRVVAFHYGGHADDLELMLSSAEGGLDVEAFGDYLAQQKGMKLVFMNACSTLAQKEALQKAGIPNIILTHSLINDAAAQAFSRSFYQNLASGREVQRAFAEASASASGQAKKGNLFRSFDTEEKEKNTPELPWELFNQAGKDWTLPTKAPFPFQKLILGILLLAAMVLLPYSYWAYLQPYDMQIPLSLPEGVDESHFGSEALAHWLILGNSPDTIRREIKENASINLTNDQGGSPEIRLKLNSKLWKLADSVYTFERDPKAIKLLWQSKFYRIEGRIFDEENVPLAGVNLSLEGTQDKTTSDQEGAFYFELPAKLIPKLRIRILTEKEGYIAQSQYFSLIRDRETETIILSKIK